MCERAIDEDPWWCLRRCNLINLMTQEMCERAIDEDPWCLEDVPDHLMTARDVFREQLMNDPECLEFVLLPPDDPRDCVQRAVEK